MLIAAPEDLPRYRDIQDTCMVLNVNQLRSFYAAAKSGSITKAAQELMVTPAAITSQIKRLEENMGLILLFRSGNAMSLTDSGAIVFEEVQKIFEDMDELEVLISNMSKGKSGELRLGCSETAAIYVMPKLITSFQHAYPGIKIIVDRGTTSEMQEALLNHRNELVLMRYMPNETRFRMRFMGRKEIVLIVANKSVYLSRDEISISELDQIPIIVSNKGSATRDIVSEHLRKFKVSPKIITETASIALTKSLVQQDKGVSFICRDGVSEEISEKRLREVHLREPLPSIEYGIAYLSRSNLSEASLAFIRMIDITKIE